MNGVAEGKVSIERIAEVFATNPAKILDLYPRKGSLQVGADADLTIVDLDREQTLRNENVVAKCGWTPLDGLTITGDVETTLVRGEPVYHEGEVVGDPGYGEFVRRGEAE
ncbi:amidohydrolase family protein [Halomicroarcula sp. GCM10025709]